ncbi:MAG: hypothetical protein JO154_01670 [Chitinophaga sp.]|uniref:hypothetical protein n=1 Tax=Chitinophaga sp. TaxID=1869181 RepID=UPI0025C634CE|nr:hypothetical protein [Chitinophaga sp.]MBV8251287.1 hypothetical protein [Chitinophaga sp.]
MMKWVLKKSNGTDNPHAVELRMKPEFDPLVNAIYTIDYELFPEFMTVVSQSENWGFSSAYFKFYDCMDVPERHAVERFEGRRMKPAEVFISQEYVGAVLVGQPEFNQLILEYGHAMLQYKSQRDLVSAAWVNEMKKALSILTGLILGNGGH